jgi:hypothetical protein
MATNHQEHIDCDSLDDTNGHGVPWETSELAISASRGPRLGESARLVEAYSERKISFPEDRLRAFLGVLGVLCGRFQGGFNFGLPEALFEVSLLGPSTYDARRISGPADETQRRSQLPSWSWTGWGGAVGMSMCLYPPRYLHSGWKEHFHRFQDYECVSWYHSTKSG